MILIDNLNVMKKSHPNILDKLQKNSKGNPALYVEESKSGDPTLLMKQNGKAVYIHSKYNPKDEAEKFISQFTDIEQYQHVLFYGFGFGYHVEAFAEKYPNVSFSIYEPNPEVLYLYLSHKRIQNLPTNQLKHLYVEHESHDMLNAMNHFVDRIKDQVLLITHPSYERLWVEQHQQFAEVFRQILSNKRFSLRTNFVFERRWTINSLMNFKYVLNSPDMINGKKEFFKDKPAILVAAGPSLEEDIEHIRYIKENGLAYIFAVGSAIKALLSYGVYPDAACTYDPQGHNVKVFEKVIEEGISNIPLVFGSSVGFETVEKYPGPKLHMITSQDTISQYMLKLPPLETPEIIYDAPSIAVITVQLLHKLGCNPIILAGQNLAFKNDQFYSTGIQYDNRPTQLSNTEKENALMVEDVYGKSITTNDSFNRMRKEMEKLITAYHSEHQFINTTKGGAKIAGTAFKDIEELIKESLKNKVVDSNWYENNSEFEYNLDYLNEKTEFLYYQFEQIKSLIALVTKQLVDVKKAGKSANVELLNKATQKFDKTFKKIQKNQFYDVFLKPLKRVQFELLLKNIEAFRYEKDPVVKSEQIVKHFGKYMTECKQDIDTLEPLYAHMHESILQVVNEQKTV
jgi:hypothetical protein